MLFRTSPTAHGADRASAVVDAVDAATQWSPALRRLRRDLAVITTASTALLWLDNVSEHYRGGFRRTLMYVPIVANPVVVAAGAVAAASGGRRGARAFGLLSTAQTAIALVGFVEPSRGILDKPGGRQPRQLLFNAWYGPPVAAPLQYLGLGLMGVMATVPRSTASPVLRHLPAHRCCAPSRRSTSLPCGRRSATCTPAAPSRTRRSGSRS